MPPANVDFTIILLDIGRNVAVEEKNEKSFFDNARACVARIIERKVMSRPKDIVSIILLGSKRTKNNLADCTDDFRHIEYLTTKSVDGKEVVSLDPPTWDLLRKLPEKPTKHEADWFEGLIVAADAFKNGLYGTRVTNKKIVLMTNFHGPVNFGENLDKVISGFQNEEFEVDIIGPNLEADEALDENTLQVIEKFVEATNGIATTFEDAMRYLMFHRKKSVKPTPWNVDLSIGPHIKIPIAAYGRIRDDKVIGSWQKAFRDPVTNTASTTEGISKRKDYFRSEDNAPMDVDQVVSGYQYGQTVVPFAETDKAMLYESGPRGLQVYGFTDAGNIQWHNLAGNGVSYIFGRNGDLKAQKALLCLVRTLQELNLVGIARRVYNNGNAPVMHALIPTVDTDNFYCLSAVALCFQDDIKGVTFPPTNLKKYAPSDDEVNGFKDLIDSMDLMRAYDDSYDAQEAIPVAATVNPSIQYVMDCLAFRAVNPGKPLPPPREDIMAPFKPPERVEKLSKDPLERLTKLLNLKEVVKKQKKVRMDPNAPATNPNAPSTSSDVATDVSNSRPSSNFSIALSMGNADDVVTNIGTVDPIGDFRTLQGAGKPFEELADELTAVIENLVYLNFDDDYTKATETMRAFREESLKGNPVPYNDWLKNFRTALAERGKRHVLEILRSEKLNVIVKEENERSSITKEELDDDNPLYEVDTVPNSTQVTIQSDVYAMFDDM